MVGGPGLPGNTIEQQQQMVGRQLGGLNYISLTICDLLISDLENNKVNHPFIMT